MRALKNYLNTVLFFCFQVFLVFCPEFIHTTRSINKLLLAGIEWMRSMGDLKLDKRIFFSVFPFNSFFGVGSGAGDKAVVV